MYFQPDYANLQDYYPFGMLIADRTYTSQTCSTVWVESNTVIYSDVQNQGHGWHSINSGSFIPDLMAIEVTSGGNNGDGAEFHFEVAHNDKEVTIDFDYIDLSNLSSFSSLNIELLDSANNVLYYTSVLQSALYYLQLPITFNATDCGTGYRLRFTLNGASNMDYISMGAINISQDFVSNNVVCDVQGYRYGFNGQEKDDDVNGVGNFLSFPFRVLDTRLGRFFSVDPLAHVYVWNSPYAFAENRPIKAIDLEGLDAWDGPNDYNVMSLSSYQRFVSAEIKILTSDQNSRRFDCTDLAVYLLCRYFESEQVPLVVTIGGKVFNSNDPSYKSFDKYYDALKYEINSDMLNSNQLTFQISANQFSDGDLYTSNGHTMVNNPTNEFNVPPDGRVWVAQAQGADMGPNHPRTRVTKPYIQSYNHVGFDQRRWNLLSNVKRHSVVQIESIKPEPFRTETPSLEIKPLEVNPAIFQAPNKK